MSDAVRCACDCHNWGAPGWVRPPCLLCVGKHEIGEPLCASACLVTTGPMGPTWCVTHGRWFNRVAAAERSPVPSPDCAAQVSGSALEDRKKAELKIEVVFEQFTTDVETALLYRILRRRGWSDDRSDAVLAKARWNG